eukprot:superscaffoldBa00000070_g1110
MGLAGRAMGTLGVSRGAPLPSLWRLALLFLSIWELDAQTAVETKPLYIWQTATSYPSPQPVYTIELDTSWPGAGQRKSLQIQTQCSND